MSINKKTVAIIVASGQSTRFKSANSSLPKQYVVLDNYPILFYSIKKMLNCHMIAFVRVVIREGHLSLYNEVSKLFFSKKLLSPVYGGGSRQESVYMGLRSIRDINPDHVIIHDANRPFFSDSILSKYLEMLNNHVAIVPVISVVDSLSFVNHNNFIITNINRDSAKILQTPQFYRYVSVFKCHNLVRTHNLPIQFSDDSAIMIECGVPVVTVEGDYCNFKITTYQDFIRGKLCLTAIL